MNRYKLTISCIQILSVVLLCTGCGGGGDADSGSFSINGSSTSNSANSLVTVTGTVNGLTTGQQVTLLNNGSDSQTITSSGDGSFSFPTQLSPGSAFDVTVGTQPISQVCSVSNSTGQATASSVIRVSVSCSEITYAVSTIVPSIGKTSGLAIDSDSNIYVSQYSTGSLMVNQYTIDGAFKNNIAFSNSGFIPPPIAFGLAIDSQNTLFVVAPSKSILAMTQAGDQRTVPTKLRDYCTKAISDKEGNILFVGCSTSSPIYRLSPDGVLSSFSSTSQLTDVITSITVDNLGNFFVTSGNQVLKLVFDGSSFTTSPFAGSQAPGFSDGTGSQASFNYAVSAAADNKGNLFVFDAGNFRIRKITPFGVVTTVAGTGSNASIDGPGATASFTSCSKTASGNYCGVAVDKSGNIIVLQSTGTVSSIRKLTPI